MAGPGPGETHFSIQDFGKNDHLLPILNQGDAPVFFRLRDRDLSRFQVGASHLQLAAGVFHLDPNLPREILLGLADRIHSVTGPSGFGPGLTTFEQIPIHPQTDGGAVERFRTGRQRGVSCPRGAT